MIAILVVVSAISVLFSVGCTSTPLGTFDPGSAEAAELAQDTENQVTGSTVGQSGATSADLSPGADRNPQYRIGPEDVLDISVLGEEDLKARLVVGPDGWVTFPMAGQLLAAGKTVFELQQEITARLRETIRDPEVSVSIAEPAGYQVFVVGKVNKPGQFVVGRQIDVLQALALAGGLTPFADEKHIKILRQATPGGTPERTFPFDYASIKRGQNLRQNLLLEIGDVVIVP